MVRSAARVLVTPYPGITATAAGPARRWRAAASWRPGAAGPRPQPPRDGAAGAAGRLARTGVAAGPGDVAARGGDRPAAAPARIALQPDGGVPMGVPSGVRVPDGCGPGHHGYLRPAGTGLWRRAHRQLPAARHPRTRPQLRHQRL